MAEIELPPKPTMQDFQRYVHALETAKGWLDVDLVHNCFLMGEEVGELFKAIRKAERLYLEAKDAQPPEKRSAATAHVAEEIVDVFNYLCAIANRLDIDVEQAFREKNALNQARVWDD